MNFRLLARFLSVVSLLIGASMAFSLPWAHPAWGGSPQLEVNGLHGLMWSMAVCFGVGALLWILGRRGQGQLFRKEAMAVVGLSWILAALLGALPYLLSGTCREALRDDDGRLLPTSRLGLADALFESQSGFSTTGATVLTDVENPELVPRSILFWRSSTHFLGGLGIIVLFVALLGQGSAGKALMRAEMPGPSKETPNARIQHTAWVLFLIYAALTAALSLLLWLQGLSPFDALCHAFGTMATGGFSTYNDSVGHFGTAPGLNGPLIELTVVVFMVLAGTNFVLLYFVVLRRPGRLLADVEWRTYVLVLLAASALVVGFGLYHHDFMPAPVGEAAASTHLAGIGPAVRYGLFQVVSIMTTTGYGTHDFDGWNGFSRGLLFLLMFVGGCAGSTGGGLKVIRHILFLKILWLEIERAFRPSVVRPLRLGGAPAPPELRVNIPIYFGLVLAIFVFSWIAVVMIEPDETWTGRQRPIEDKLIDSASGIAATMNNIGPGLGTVGATQNYAHFSAASKLLFTWLMMVGRLEVFVILVLLIPGFWRNR